MVQNVWKEIPPGENVPDVVNVFIEIPKGCRNKYEYDKEYGIIRLDRVLYSPFHYPFDYGFIPGTYCEDGDPLDALVIMDEPTYPGVLVEAVPIGLLEMIDSGERDEKILCVPAKDPRYKEVKDIKDVPEHILKEISHFFEHYKDLQGKKTEIIGWKGSIDAKRKVVEAVELYKKEIE
ncbi:MAG TPA: inorganic diphosphatase [Euryarchaeota archaeon]|nr:inorganic diphosphatase [Euryarchaeota archaeon]